MKDKNFWLSSILILLLSMSLGLVVNVAGHSVARTHDFVVATVWGPETVDPAWCYDTVSAELIFNVYDSLVRFKVDRTRPAEEQGRTDEFEACIATEWVTAAPPHTSSPPYTDSTYYFRIRENVPYHDGSYGYVAPADVEYSFERWMVLDRTGGPTWMIYEPLLEIYGVDWDDPEMATKIDNAVESNSTHVWFNLAAPNYPPMIFMQIIAQSWASIMPNEWAYQHGCWPGEAHPELDPYTIGTMFAYHDPEVSPLDAAGWIECGSGPYTLDAFNTVEQWYRLVWFPDYWQGWPAPGCNEYGYQGQCGYEEGWIKTVTIMGVDEWTTRKLMFLAGDADFCYVPRKYIPQIITNWDEDPSWEEEEYPPGIVCFPGLPMLALDAIFPNININTVGNMYIGDPPYDELHESGIPYWFFNDTNVRKAFAYCFNWTSYVEDAYFGEAEQPSSPIVKGLAYWEYLWDVDDPDLSPPDTPDKDLPGGDPWSQPDFPNGTNGVAPNPMYYKNEQKARDYFEAAHNGTLMYTGFTFSIVCTFGDEARLLVALMIEEAVESINPDMFHINVYEISWPTYLGQMVAGKLPLFITGWQASYPDPHGFFHPFMHSTGTLSQSQSYSNSTVDELIVQGIKTADDNERIDVYHKLCNIYFEDAVSIPLVQPIGRHWQRDWIEGWYHNPIYPGSYFYHLWKGYQGDVNRNYVVDIFDLIIVAVAYGSSPGDPNWNPCADVNGDGTVDIFDLTIVSAQYG